MELLCNWSPRSYISSYFELTLTHLLTSDPHQTYPWKKGPDPLPYGVQVICTIKCMKDDWLTHWNSFVFTFNCPRKETTQYTRKKYLFLKLSYIFHLLLVNLTSRIRNYCVSLYDDETIQYEYRFFKLNEVETFLVIKRTSLKEITTNFKS